MGSFCLCRFGAGIEHGVQCAAFDGRAWWYHQVFRGCLFGQELQRGRGSGNGGVHEAGALAILSRLDSKLVSIIPGMSNHSNNIQGRCSSSKGSGCVFPPQVFSVQSAALRHLFLAERMAQKVPGVNEKPAPLKKIGILGAGLMGGGIAMCFVQKGVPVVLKDAKQEWLDDGMKKIQGLWGGQAKRGRLSQDKYKQYMSLLKPTLDYADFKDVDMVIEAVPEIMDLKKEVFLDIERNTKPDALICTNTSGLNIDDIAAVLKDPSRVMGTHFFSPANVMQLLENVRTSKSSTKTLATGMAPRLHTGHVALRWPQ